MGNRFDDPYAPPRASLEGAADDPAGSVLPPDEDLLAFVGRDGPQGRFYLRSWKRTRGRYRRGWNWAAFLFNTTWFFYRKMYKEAIVLELASVGLSLAVGVGAYLLLGEASALLRLVDVGVAIVIGMTANGLYLRRAIKAIRALSVSKLDPEQRRHLLSVQGGTSRLNILLGLIVRAGVFALLGNVSH